MPWLDCAALAHAKAAMIDSDVQCALDNPYWSSLATRHAHLAQGGALARRYPPAISRIAGLAGSSRAHVAALESLVAVGDDMGTAGPFVPRLPANWETVEEFQLFQMIRVDRTPLPEVDVGASVLTAADAGEAMALVELARPGPFRPRTMELGTYVGVRVGGRLVAMAGERLWVDDFREVSGVCTHPLVEGRGYARALVARVVNRMMRSGETPFLHVRSHNKRAIELYRRLGFVRRAQFPMLYARRRS